MATGKAAPSGYTEAIAAWDEEFRAAFDARYPWMFSGREADGGRVKAWLGPAGVRADDIEPGIGRLRWAMRAYFAAVKAGTSWPTGEPAQTRHFTREVSKWLQPTKTRTSPSGRHLVGLDLHAAAAALLDDEERGDRPRPSSIPIHYEVIE